MTVTQLISRDVRLWRELAAASVAGALMMLSACGGGSSSSPDSAPGSTSYTVGGTVSGVSGSGLVLQNNGADNLSVSASTSFTFTTPVTAGKSYDITVFSQPIDPAQDCVVTQESGTVNAKVTDVQVACTTMKYTLGGTVSGLAGSGLVLQDNGADNLSVNANGSFSFATALTSGTAYAVTVSTQPGSPAQTCTVGNAKGLVSAKVTDVQITCTTNTYTIGGVIIGLAGSGLVLQDNGGDNLNIRANGSFTFSTAIPSGAAYSVTVLTQPSDPAQTCSVGNPVGTVSADVTSVTVVCTTINENKWTWVSGSNTPSQLGVYGIQGVAAPGNVPGARTGAASWTDAEHDLWLFGGMGYAAAGAAGLLNDLWEFKNGQWIWVSGSNTASQPGAYGALGVPSAANVPGARVNTMTWIDSNGTLWLFGGFGLGTGSTGALNDLWAFNAGEWTWVSGASATDQEGNYGTQGLAAATNVPGGRQGGSTWLAGGDLWLFGGSGFATTQVGGLLADLWKFSAGQWTWESGVDVIGSLGIYGTQGQPSASNAPGARYLAVSWLDAGNLRLFGGDGYASSPGTTGLLSDQWLFSANEWTWVGGGSGENQMGDYGTIGSGAAGNAPGARQGAVSWTDADGNPWLFGGNGEAAAGSGDLNDLWELSAGQWRWVSGANTPQQPGTYGVLGVAAAGNVPGAREGAATWIDANGDLCLFGGQGLAAAGPSNYLNDLWCYTP